MDVRRRRATQQAVRIVVLMLKRFLLQDTSSTRPVGPRNEAEKSKQEVDAVRGSWSS
jgi:hypothetical protein